MAMDSLTSTDSFDFEQARPLMLLSKRPVFTSLDTHKSVHSCYPLTDLKLIGEGKSAYVYRISGTNSVVKVYKPDKLHEYISELNVYERLMRVKPPHFLHIEEYGTNYIRIPYVNGKTIYQKMLDKEYISKELVESVYAAVEQVRAMGMFPNDLHMKNIIEEYGTGEIYILDVARFLNKESDGRFDNLYKAYHRHYKLVWKYRNWFSNPKNILRIIKLYRKLENGILRKIKK